jgi:hypothetical protein
MTTSISRSAPPETLAAFSDGLLWQAILFILTALTLDLHFLNHLLLVSVAAQWIGVVMLLVRRGEMPNRTDIHYCRYGIFVAFGFALAAGPMIIAVLQPRLVDKPLLERWTGIVVFRDMDASTGVVTLSVIWIATYSEYLIPGLCIKLHS